jgi:hypothetical protein
MCFTDLGSVVSYVVDADLAVTGVIGVGAAEVFFAGGLDCTLASILPISLACK